jgi:hypothetical protein
MTSAKASAFIAPALLVACIAAYFVVFLPPSLADSGPFAISTSYDFHSYFLPKFIYGSRELASGRFPLWNPYEDGGVPFFATAQPALLYPPKAVLFFLLEPVHAYVAFLILHYLALGGGFFLFLREERISGAAAFAGAAVWTFSVPIMMSNYHPTRIANMVFVPLVFVAVERIARGAGRRAVALLALVVALQLLAGYPECAVDTGLLVALHATTRFATKEWAAPPWKTVPVFALAFALGAFVAAVQLVPLVEAAVAAGRSSVAEVIRTNQPVAPEQFAAPAIFSVPGLVGFGWLALFVRRGRAATVGVVTCILLGKWGWVWLQRLPGLSMLRFPYVWLELSPFFVGWLTALGLDTCFSIRRPARLMDRAGAALVVATSVAWAGYCAFEWHRLRSGAPPLGGAWNGLARNVGSETTAALGIVGGLGLSMSMIGPVRARWGASGSVLPLVLLVVSHEASYPFGARPAPFAPPAPHGEVSGYVSGDLTMNGRAVSMHDIQYGYALTDRIPSALGAEESFVPLRFRRVLERFELWPLFGHLDWAGLASAGGLLDALDVDFLVVPLEVAPGLWASDFAPIRRGVDTILFKNPNPMGHAWVDYAVRVVPSPAAALEYVLGPAFDPHSEVVLENRPEGIYPVRSDLTPTLPSAERRISASIVEYDVDLPRPGVLVASESIYPGWKVIVDGLAAKLLPADYVLRGVELGAGRHQVRFEYRPRSIWVGAGASAAGVLALLGLFFGRRPPVTKGKASHDD